MTDKNDDKAQALIDSLVPRLMDSLKEGVSKQVEDQIKPLLDKHAQLQDRLQDNKRDDDAIAKLAEQVHKLSGAPSDTPPAVYITREQSRDAATYQQVKKRADELGVPMIRVEAEGQTDGQTVYTPG